MSVELLTITESSTSKYGPRTYENAYSADVTIAIAIDFTTSGEMLTAKAGGERYIGIEFGVQPLLAARRIYSFMKRLGAKSVNLAGNGIYTFAKYNVTQEIVNQYVYDIFCILNKYIEITSLRSGGQTGVDLAAGVVGPLLNIPVTLHFPSGCLQRHEDGKDARHTHQQILEQILKWQNKLTT